jgi:hypothetical protein
MPNIPYEQKINIRHRGMSNISLSSKNNILRVLNEAMKEYLLKKNALVRALRDVDEKQKGIDQLLQTLRTELLGL